MNGTDLRAFGITDSVAKKRTYGAIRARLDAGLEIDQVRVASGLAWD